MIFLETYYLKIIVTHSSTKNTPQFTNEVMLIRKLFHFTEVDQGIIVKFIF